MDQFRPSFKKLRLYLDGYAHIIRFFTKLGVYLLKNVKKVFFWIEICNIVGIMSKIRIFGYLLLKISYFSKKRYYYASFVAFKNASAKSWLSEASSSDSDTDSGSFPASDKTFFTLLTISLFFSLFGSFWASFKIFLAS